MKYNKIGKTGLKVSNLCLGTMTFGYKTDKNTSYKILDKAYDNGILFFDTSNSYPVEGPYDLLGVTEEIIGDWAQNKRDKIIIASKCFSAIGPGPNDRGLSRKHIMQSIEGSLKRLKTDYLDLYQAHRFDNETDLEETLRAFDDLVTQGKVRYIGVSNWRSWQVAKANGIADLKNFVHIDCLQPRYNLLFRSIEEDIIPLALSEGIGIISYNPLAGGMLAGRYHKKNTDKEGLFTFGKTGQLYQERYWQDSSFRAVEKYEKWCKENSRNMITTAIQWVIQQEGISSTIIGATQPEQLDEIFQANFALTLTEEELNWLNQLWFSLPRRHEDR
jgi:aryl-alcohol dehydrogenase (NADP+)